MLYQRACFVTRDMAIDLPTPQDSGRLSIFSLPLEIRNFIYENLLSPIPLPPTLPQNKTTFLPPSYRPIGASTMKLLTFFAIHLRSKINKSRLRTLPLWSHCPECRQDQALGDCPLG
jgi:hypothetical protein